ncbi:MAG: DNA/RNA nuclease SfsA [Methanobrevibacter sp.]|uniref:DNA/RNA nuclease SfsA n=1 Tax=Methanobrevibacter sp. TaxID=66852 RepID=UPI0025ECA1C1|nr:DNA/RNA nuclease SfsA [Methanobrevibacter sp.]MBR0271565.1 DNA/RNA nuclease SfsA [Methanobrevibacter sp.]
MTKYLFKNTLIEAIIVKRNSQFTLDVDIDGIVEKVHCPTTGRIGDIDLKNVACLISPSDNPNRKTKYTLEAVSVDNLDVEEKSWIGINQIASNKYIEFFISEGLFKDVVGDFESISREVKLGKSKLDLLVDNTYLEVKTPLQTLQVEYGSDIKRKKVTPFSSTDRFVKHMNELAGSLKDNERAILLNTFQYDNPGFKIINKSTNYEEVSSTVKDCVEKGVEIWQVNMKIDAEGVELIKVWDISEIFLDGSAWD